MSSRRDRSDGMGRRQFLRSLASTVAAGLGVALAGSTRQADASSCGVWCQLIACDQFSCGSPDFNQYRCRNNCTGETFTACFGGCSSFCYSLAC